MICIKLLLWTRRPSSAEALVLSLATDDQSILGLVDQSTDSDAVDLEIIVLRLWMLFSFLSCWTD
jgi:hypothetical protein